MEEPRKNFGNIWSALENLSRDASNLNSALPLRKWSKRISFLIVSPAVLKTQPWKVSEFSILWGYILRTTEPKIKNKVFFESLRRWSYTFLGIFHRIREKYVTLFYREKFFGSFTKVPKSI